MLKTLDLFAGAGGLSWGFAQTGKFQIVAAVENDPYARKTYIRNHGNVRMILDVIGFNFAKLSDEFNGIDIVIGGPPCQGFSNANRQKSSVVCMNNSLVKEFFRAIREIRPLAFVMENDIELKKAYEYAQLEYEVLKQLVKMRNEMGLSQSDVAKKSGLTQQMVSRIETVGNSPTLRNFLKYVDSLGLEIKLEKKNNNMEYINV
jgi:DNA (cytosine-5)-methyltransferase 1